MAMSKASLIKAANAKLLVEGKLDAVEQFFKTDYVVHITDKDVQAGHDFVTGFLKSIRRSFPDVQVEVEILLQQGSRIAWQRVMRATHKVAYKGFPGSGRKIVWRDMVVSDIRDGLIAEDWVLTDLAEQLLLSRKQPGKK